MKPYSLKLLMAALGGISSISFSQAGLMHPDYPLQTYRDFAENRGIFSANAENVEIRYTDGTVAGTIPRMMSFESVVDAGFAGLVGNAQFLASVAHNGGYKDASFTKRFGGDDFYRVIKKNNGWGEKTNYMYDIQVARLDKMVTEAAFVPYMEDERELAGLKGKLVLRAGGGTQKIAAGKDGKEQDVAGAYSFLTGGTVIFNNVIVNPPKKEENTPASVYKAYQFQYNLRTSRDPEWPLPIGVLAGDSGSPTWAWHEKNRRWEYIGPGQSGGGGGFSQMRGSNAWCVDVIKSYDDPPVISMGGKPLLLWGRTNDKGKGKITQGNKSWNYHGLADSKKFSGASLEELEETRNLIFTGKPGAIQLEAPVDMGSGTLTFRSSFRITAQNPSSTTLNCAGMDIGDRVTVTSELTSTRGDEWRKIGKGTLVIQGKGDNPVELNIGEGTVRLARKNGTAARQVKLVSGRGRVVLSDDSQLLDPVQFGVRGGLLDLNGNNISWHEIPHIDTGAIIGTNKGRAVFTYTGTGNYLGQFIDRGEKGALSLVYAPESGESRWTLQGKIITKGGITVKKGILEIKGAPTLHANNFIDPQDWRRAIVELGGAPIQLSPGAGLLLAEYSKTAANILVPGQSTLALLDNAVWKGRAVLDEGAILKVSSSAGASDRVLHLKGPVTLIPVMPREADAAQALTIDIGKLEKPVTREELDELIRITPDKPSNGGAWIVGITPEGMLRAAWTPGKTAGN